MQFALFSNNMLCRIILNGRSKAWYRAKCGAKLADGDCYAPWLPKNMAVLEVTSALPL